MNTSGPPGSIPRSPPVDLLATDFKQRLQEHKSDRAKASEIEQAIKHHIEVNLEQDEIRRVKQRIKRRYSKPRSMTLTFGES
jgi:transposase